MLPTATQLVPYDSVRHRPIRTQIVSSGVIKLDINGILNPLYPLLKVQTSPFFAYCLWRWNDFTLRRRLGDFPTVPQVQQLSAPPQQPILVAKPDDFIAMGKRDVSIALIQSRKEENRLRDQRLAIQDNIDLTATQEHDARLELNMLLSQVQSAKTLAQFYIDSYSAFPKTATTSFRDQLPTLSELDYSVLVQGEPCPLPHSSIIIQMLDEDSIPEDEISLLGWTPESELRKMLAEQKNTNVSVQQDIGRLEKELAQLKRTVQELHSQREALHNQLERITGIGRKYQAACEAMHSAQLTALNRPTTSLSPKQSIVSKFLGLFIRSSEADAEKK